MKQQTTAGGIQPQTLGMVQTALFAALILILAFTPFLGYIPLGFTRATIIHIPVIIASITLGPKKGAYLGFVFGLTSLINNTFNPTATSFVFSPFYSLGAAKGGIGSLAVCFIPRILVGIIPFFVYRALSKLSEKKGGSNMPALALAGMCGALTNTLLVMHMILLFFGNSYANANGIAANGVYQFILSVIAINGVPEAIVAAILTALIVTALQKAHIV